jgi:hypothetical protein
VPLIVTDVGDRLHVGLVALERVVVTAQVRETAPVNEFDGVTVMVEVFPLVAPGLTEIVALLVSAKLVLLLGACQKLLHPARNGATDNNSHAHLPIFIAAPSTPLSASSALRVSLSRRPVLL